MANELFRNHAHTLIRTAVMHAKDAAGIDHNGLRGRVREIMVERLLRPFILGQFDIGTGKIVDAEDNQSAETDIVLYSRNVLPPIMYSERDGIFPIEASFYALEVKSKITAEEITDAVRKATTLWQLKSLASGIGIVPACFSFDTDLTVGGKSELERYSEIDPNWRIEPRIQAICVVGRGYWWYEDTKWCFHPPTEYVDEVIDFISGIMNTLPNSLLSRGYPRLGRYLIAHRQVEIL